LGASGNKSRSTTASRPRANRRRDVAQTRAAILDAAERRLIIGGPDAIRLEKIAADAGVSHPAILHHFKSREGLVEAMVLNGLKRFQAQVLAGWPSAKEPDIEGTFQRFYEIASQRGVARMLAGLILMHRDVAALGPDVLRPAAERLHAGRLRRADRDGGRVPELEDSMFVATFLMIIVLGDSMFGTSVQRAIGLHSKDSAQRFRRWLVKMIDGMARRDSGTRDRAEQPNS
jgi:TetR/AcrR family transcriptional regulator, repressor for neighboring sulfatase